MSGSSRPSLSSPLEDGEIYDLDRIIGPRQWNKIDPISVFSGVYVVIAGAIALFGGRNSWSYLGMALLFAFPWVWTLAARSVLRRKGYHLKLGPLQLLSRQACRLSNRLGEGWTAKRLLSELPSREDLELAPIFRADDLPDTLHRALNLRALAIVEQRKRDNADGGEA
jgi:hypothetical protein